MHFQFLPHKKVILLWKKYKILLAWLGFEPIVSRSEVHYANHYTIEASYKEQIFYVEVYNVLLFCEVKIKMHITYNEWILVLFLLFFHFSGRKFVRKADDSGILEEIQSHLVSSFGFLIKFQKKECRTNTNTRAVCNKRAGGIFFSKLINVHARLFGTLAECARTDLNKRFLPKPMTATG